MNLTIRHVETDHIQRVWGMVEPFIQSAIDKGEGPADYNIHHVQMFLTSGAWLLLVAVDEEGTVHGAGTVSFINYPLNRVAFFTTMGGNLITGEETFAQLSALLKFRGATKIQGFVRPAMERLLDKFGFKPGNKLVEVVL
jgi:hypothetical protein